MDKTITIRLDKTQDEALTARAKAFGKTKSELIRELIDKGLQEEPLVRRVGHLKGQLKVRATGKEWQRRIRNRNWR
jgi:predicted DNA-binding protein